MQPPPEAERHPGRTAGLLLVPALLAVLVHAGTLRAGFVHDDPASVRFSAELAEEGWRGFLLSLRGLHHATIHLDSLLHGARPAGFHATNIALAALATALAAALALRLSGDRRVALATGLLFAVHPVHVEAVASIENRKELLAFACVAGSLLAWTARERRRSGYALALSLYAIGVLWVKEVAVAGALPLYLAADRLGGVPRRRALRRFALPGGLALLAALALAGPLRRAYSPAFVHEISDWHFTHASQVLAGVAESFPATLGLLFLPVHLVQDHPFPSGDPLAARTLAGAALLAGLVGSIPLLARRAPLSAFALLWILATWLPSSNVVPLIPHFVAERFLYVPSFGACLLIAAVLARLAGASVARPLRLASPAVLALLVTLGAAHSFLRCRDWIDSETLNATALARGADTWRIHFRAARFARAAGDPERAAEHYRRAIELRPGLGLFHFELGRALLESRRFPEAVRAFEEASRLADLARAAPRLPARFGFRTEDEAAANALPGEPLRWLGIARAEAGDLDGAVEALRAALGRQPLDLDTHDDLAVALARRARLATDLATWGRGRRPDPGLAARWLRLAEGETGDDARRAALGEAACFAPGDAGIAARLVRHLATRPDPALREPALALALGRRATERAPHDPAAWTALGAARLRAGEPRPALEALARAVELGGDGHPYRALLRVLAGREAGAPEEEAWRERAVEALGSRPVPADLAPLATEALATRRD